MDDEAYYTTYLQALPAQVQAFMQTRLKLKPKTRLQYAKMLTRLTVHAQGLGKTLVQLTEPDVIAWVSQFHGNYYNNALGVARQYYAWKGLHATGENTSTVVDSKTGECCVKTVQETHPYLEKVGQKPRATQEAYVQRITSLSAADVQKLSAAALNLRDRAIVAVLSDCGFRAGELVSIRVKDVVHNANGSVSITCPKGKTGERTVSGDICSADLAAWENAHPTHNPDAPLFCVIRKTGDTLPGDPLDEYTLFNNLRAVGTRAGILLDSRGISGIHPHALRHFSCTESARMGLSMQDMMLRFGWVSFEMPKRYVHLVEKDSNDNWQRKRGLAPEREGPKTNICPHCHHGNPTGQVYCGLCATPLNPEARKQLAAKKEQGHTIQDEIEAIKADLYRQMREELQRMRAEMTSQRK